LAQAIFKRINHLNRAHPHIHSKRGRLMITPIPLHFLILPAPKTSYRRHLKRVVWLVIACILVGIGHTRHPAYAQGSIGACPVFPANNWWNRDVSADPVDPNSAAYINFIGASKFLHPDFGSNLTYGIPYVVVNGSQPKVPITFTAYGNQSDPGPYPIPLNAPIEAGSDAHVIAVDTTNCKLYELYAASRNNSGGYDAASGAIFDLRSNQLRPDTWTSADAAGLPIFAGLARYDEVSAGVIAHALRFTVRETQRKFIHPATHFASGTTTADRPPMGLRLRMKASYNINTLTGQARVVATALKKYGMIVADNGSDWYISGATDSHWDDVSLDQLKNIPGSAFEVVQSVTPTLPDHVGAYKDGVFYLRNTNTTGPANLTVVYGGSPTHQPLTGDWNGDGVDTIGVYDTSTGLLQLRDSNTAGSPTYVFAFGNPGDTAFAGRWVSSATHDGVGVYRNSNGILYLRNSLSTGFQDFFMIFGNPGDSGFAGDWEGDGVASVGIYRPGTQHVYLSNVNGAGITFSDLDFAYNFGANRLVVGDWTGDGFSRVSFFSQQFGTFNLMQTLRSESAYTSIQFGPVGSYPLAGRWVASTAPDPIAAEPSPSVLIRPPANPTFQASDAPKMD
jgi:hypothetical protein